MIARTWRGFTSAEDADRYLAYLQETGLKAFRETPGNRGVYALRRIVDDRAEFLLLTLWDSAEAVLAFAGDEPGKAVFYPEDERYLLARDLEANHFDVVFAAGDGGGPDGR